MSKAFTRESDDDDEAPELPLGAELPPGVKNYVTPQGAARLHEEIERLAHVERPAGVAGGDAKALREIDRRLAFLGRRREALEVIAPAERAPERVVFGSTVTVAGADGVERHYRLVGVDEADPPHGELSWRSPIATALLGAQVGDVRTLRSPRGDEELEVTALSYARPPAGKA
jgi:transcription elongation factor GreB